MKKITMFVLSLCIVMGAIAQIDTSKEYRIQDTSTGLYLNAADHVAHTEGPIGGVNLAYKAENNEQIFTFEAAGSGYYLKTKSGYYIYCQEWNVDALSSKSLLTFATAGNGNYYIMNGSKYFKTESVSGTYYPFCNAEFSSAATWKLVEKDDNSGSTDNSGDNGTINSTIPTEEVYDFSGFGDEKLLVLFYNALQKGRNYPTMAEFEAAGIQAADLAFVRSHVRKAEIMSREDRLLSDTYQERDLWMNVPMDAGKAADVGYPCGKFLADVYSMWQYTNLFGAWNHGIFTVPGAWVDAAHRNGTDMMSGIKFFDTTGGRGEGSETYEALITKKDSNGDFMYVKPLINILMFFGSDGINYNWEATGYNDSDVVNFHKQLYKYAAECGFTNYHSGLYTMISSMTAANVDYMFGKTATGKTHDTMLNYSGGAFSVSMATSASAAKAAMGTTKGLYAGVWIASIENRGWTKLNNGLSKEVSLCLWGEHSQSRFYSYNVGDGAFNTQENYQKLLERGFSGGYRNPATRPAIAETGFSWERTATSEALGGFAGLASWIPERSTIQGNLPFKTHFTLGNGDRYYYKGKQSLAGEWYNMSSQDIVPTYRWLRYKANTTTVTDEIDVNYTHIDAYTGGSCINLTGASTSAGTDIIMYKTSLKVAGTNPYAKLAVKTLKNTKASDLYLIVKLQGESSYREFAYGTLSGNTWEEKTISLSGISTGKIIERIGLRVKGSNSNYQLYVGKLEINDNRVVTPSNVKDLVAEVKNETKTSMTVKLHWDVNATANTRANWGLVYNDEANISHFEILYKNSENGKVSLVGTTSQWATIIPNIDFESVNDKPYVGVRAVSVDQKTYSPISWVEIPRAAQSSLPAKYKQYGNYGMSTIDVDSDGIANAQNGRYLTYVKTSGATQNLNYTANAPVADGTNYVNARNQVLKVKQGQTVTIQFQAFNTTTAGPFTDKSEPDGLRWCFAGGWIDFNGSGDFDKPLPTERTANEIANGSTTTDPEGERVFFAGSVRAGTPAFETSGVSYTFTVPTNATPGQSCLRIVFSDAWFPAAFNPTGYHNKGFSIDFGVEIEGSNPGRVIVNTRDQGEAEQPEGIGDSTTNVDEVAAEGISAAEGVEGAINIANAEKAWVYTVDGKLVEFVKNPTQIAVEAGVYLVKMQNGNIIRSSKVLVK